MNGLDIVFGLAAGLVSVNAIAALPLQVKVINEVTHDVSAPLSEMALNAQATMQEAHKIVPLHRVPLKLKLLSHDIQDKAIQPTTGLTLNTINGHNFEGLGQGFPGYFDSSVPPDTNASVGLTQIVQWVNTDFIVFNKTTGAVIQGATPGNAFWAGFADTRCRDQNSGDPIVKYDQLANRWVMTQFAVETSGHFTQCIAVSTTSDATGTYHRYSYDFNDNFNDYGKLGVWPDAYYMSFVMFPGGEPNDMRTALPTSDGPSACAFDRAKMLAGQAATMQCFQPTPAAGIFLPADLDGTNPPPTGSPNYFVGLYQSSLGQTLTNKLALWKFHVNWTTPSLSYFHGPTAIDVTSFNPIICSDSNDNCAVQKGTSQRLEVLGDRLMHRLAYRNFPTYQTMVVNQNIRVGSQGPGTRWYEIRINSDGTARVFQQGTYAQNDNNARWMGSIAMDKKGNMALGYSISGSDKYPSIRYTGRVVTDPINTMRTEKEIASGTSFQVMPSGYPRNRWGDYSSMAIDPSDGCTFWYTNEYIKVSGAFIWSTRIASFRFPNCS